MNFRTCKNIHLKFHLPINTQANAAWQLTQIPEPGGQLAPGSPPNYASGMFVITSTTPGMEGCLCNDPNYWSLLTKCPLYWAGGDPTLCGFPDTATLIANPKVGWLQPFKKISYPPFLYFVQYQEEKMKITFSFPPCLPVLT